MPIRLLIRMLYLNRQFLGSGMEEITPSQLAAGEIGPDVVRVTVSLPDLAEPIRRSILM
jgi:hypothetical protein